MGHTQMRVENAHISTQQKELSPLALASYDENMDEFDIREHRIQMVPITIPYFNIKITPFKYLNNSCSTLPLPGEVKSAEQDLTIPSKQWTWMEVINHPTLFSHILAYISYEDDTNLILVSKRIKCEVFLHRLFGRANNWPVTLQKIQRKLLMGVNNYYLLANNEEESEHSLDLDRTESFFLYESGTEIQDIGWHVSQLDRVMRALSSSAVPYSQGMNSIVAVLLAFFSEDKIFWLVKLLLAKTDNIVTNCDAYRQFMAELDAEVEKTVPKVYRKLEQNDFNIEYFAMKWIMGLFSYDLPKEVLFILWDLVYNFEGKMVIKFFIVSLFEALEDRILRMEDSDEINNYFKEQLKSKISSQMYEGILRKTRIKIGVHRYGKWVEFTYSHCIFKQCSNEIKQKMQPSSTPFDNQPPNPFLSLLSMIEASETNSLPQLQLLQKQKQSQNILDTMISPIKKRGGVHCFENEELLGENYIKQQLHN